MNDDIEQQLIEAAELLMQHKERVKFHWGLTGTPLAYESMAIEILPPPPPTLTALAYAIRDALGDIEKKTWSREAAEGLDVMRRWLASREEGVNINTKGK